MALFDLPLHKPGNKKCPTCGNPVWGSSMSSLWLNGSSSYPCSRCGAALEVDMNRLILGLVIWFASCPPALWGMRYGPSWAGMLLFYSIFLLPIPMLWWFTSVRVAEKVPSEQTEWHNPPWYKPGNKHCPNCGLPPRKGSIRPFWSIRYCTGCGAGLREDRGRAILGLVILTVQMATILFVVLWGVFRESLVPFWIEMPLYFYLLLLGTFHQWWFVSIRLSGEAALAKPNPS